MLSNEPFSTKKWCNHKHKIASMKILVTVYCDRSTELEKVFSSVLLEKLEKFSNSIIFVQVVFLTENFS